MCPPGYFCSGATIHPVPCPAGFYCKEGKDNDPSNADNFPYPCEKGTYGYLTTLVDSSECKSCDAGFYCAETGADSPTGMCDAGFYCTGGAKGPRPNENVDYTVAVPAIDATAGGQVCPQGGYCEQGSSWPKYCQGGFYNS